MLQKTCTLILCTIHTKTNDTHDNHASILEDPVAKVDDLVTMHAVLLVVIELVVILSGRESNVASDEDRSLLPPSQR